MEYNKTKGKKDLYSSWERQVMGVVILVMGTILNLKNKILS